MTEVRNVELELARFRGRLLVVGLLILAALLLLFGRASVLQVLRHEELAARAEANRTTILPVVPIRGLIVDLNGRRYSFCSEPCKWVFEQDPAQFAGHLSIIDRLLGGIIQPPSIPGALAYMGLSPEECGVDGNDYEWALGKLTPAKTA